MKKHLNKIAVLAVIILTLSFGASAQMYVHERPVRPNIVRTAPPSPRHVWIDEDWEMRDGRYNHVGGRWVLPPHPGYIWVSGHWAHRRGGWVWVAGHWRPR